MSIEVWLEEKIANSSPAVASELADASRIEELAQACAVLNGASGSLFGMTSPTVTPAMAALYASGCETLGRWLAHLDRNNALRLLALIEKHQLDVVVADENEVSPEEIVELLRKERQRNLMTLGVLADTCLSRLNIADDAVRWPSCKNGRLHVVYLRDSVLLVTEGLSDPVIATVHSSEPPKSVAFEIALQIPNSEFRDLEVRTIAESPYVAALWQAADQTIRSQTTWNPRSSVTRGDVTTLAIRTPREWKHVGGKNGCVGFLLGLPPHPSEPEQQFSLAGTLASSAVLLLPMKLLTADEYDLALTLSGDHSGFQQDLLKTQHLSWTSRQSVLTSSGKKWKLWKSSPDVPIEPLIATDLAMELIGKFHQQIAESTTR